MQCWFMHDRQHVHFVVWNKLCHFTLFSVMPDVTNPISDGLCVIDCGGVFPRRGRLGLRCSLNSNWTRAQVSIWRFLWIPLDINRFHPVMDSKPGKLMWSQQPGKSWTTPKDNTNKVETRRRDSDEAVSMANESSSTVPHKDHLFSHRCGVKSANAGQPQFYRGFVF